MLRLRARGGLLALLVLVVTATLAPVGRAAAGPTVDAAAAVAAAPIEAAVGDFPDPSIMRAPDGSYYAFGTNRSGFNIPVVQSRDLVSWASADPTLPAIDALPQLPAWADPGQTWAPSVVGVRGGYALFYAVRNRAAQRQCISQAFSMSPYGPFTDTSSGPLVCQTASGGSIDPDAFYDVDGSLWLIWKSEGRVGREATIIWSQRMSADGRSFVGEPTRLLQTDQPWEEPIVENPSMVAADGRYYVFYSANRWQTANYAIGFAVCETPAGPCIKPRTSPWLRSGSGFVGPGGADVFHDGAGRTWIAYHAWTAGRVGYPSGGARTLRLEPLSFDRGWPVTASSAGAGAGRVDGVVVDVGAWSGGGFLTVTAGGAVAARSGAPFLGDASGLPLNRWVVDVQQTATGGGYWLAASDGGIFSFGDAPFFGSTGSMTLNQPVVGMAPTPSGQGYWLVAADGGIFSFGDAPFFGSTGSMRLNQPIVGMAATPSGQGYWLVASDGGIFSFGDAPFLGSTGGMALLRPIIGMAARPERLGYWLAAADGAVFSFGDVDFHGALDAAVPVTGIVAEPGGYGYWLVGSDGTAWSYGAATPA
jgi:hypothetical protein